MYKERRAKRDIANEGVNKMVYYASRFKLETVMNGNQKIVIDETGVIGFGDHAVGQPFIEKVKIYDQLEREQYVLELPDDQTVDVIKEEVLRFLHHIEETSPSMESSVLLSGREYPLPADWTFGQMRRDRVVYTRNLFFHQDTCNPVAVCRLSLDKQHVYVELQDFDAAGKVTPQSRVVSFVVELDLFQRIPGLPDKVIQSCKVLKEIQGEDINKRPFDRHLIQILSDLFSVKQSGELEQIDLQFGTQMSRAIRIESSYMGWKFAQSEEAHYSVLLRTFWIQGRKLSVRIDNFNSQPLGLHYYSAEDLQIDPEWENVYAKEYKSFDSFAAGLMEMKQLMKAKDYHETIAVLKAFIHLDLSDEHMVKENLVPLFSSVGPQEPVEELRPSHTSELNIRRSKHVDEEYMQKVKRLAQQQGVIHEINSTLEEWFIQFDHHGSSIVNPFFSECMRFEVEPVKYYGDSFLESGWFSDQLQLLEDMVIRTTPEINKRKLDRLAEQLKLLSSCMVSISSLWEADESGLSLIDSILDENYPFDRSFYELSHDVVMWCKQACWRIENP